MVRRIFGHGAFRLYLLTLLAERPMHGYELIRLMEDQFLGLYTPSAGTIYPRLAALEAEGLVTHDEVDGRKVYRLTDAGRQEVEARRGELADLRSQAAEAARTAGHLARRLGDDVRSSVGELRTEWRDLARQARHEERRARRHAEELWQSRERVGSPAPWDLARRWDVEALGDLVQEWGQRFAGRRPPQAESGEPGEGTEQGQSSAAGGAQGGPRETATGASGAARGRSAEQESRAGLGSLVGDLQDFLGDVASAVRALELDPERVARLREALAAAREAVLAALHGSATDAPGEHEAQGRTGGDTGRHAGGHDDR